jgi:hypothetical protein
MFAPVFLAPAVFSTQLLKYSGVVNCRSQRVALHNFYPPPSLLQVVAIASNELLRSLSFKRCSVFIRRAS